MPKNRRSARAAATLAIAAAMSVAAPAAALPPGDTGPAWVPVTGIARDGSFLTGYFKPSHFDLDANGALVATGALTGRLSRAGALQTPVDQQITLPVDRQPTTGSCRMVDLAVGPQDLPVAGPMLHMDQAILNISMPQGPGSRLLVPLCDAGNMMKAPPAQSNPGLRDLLNQMLRLLGQGG